MRYWEGDRYEGDAQFDELLSAYEQSLDTGSALYLDADELTDLAEYYISHGQAAKAWQAIERATELHPDAVAPRTFRIRDCICRGCWDEAERLLSGINDIDGDREVMYLRVELLLHKDKADEADRLLLQHFPADDSASEQRLYMHEVISLLLDYDGPEVDRMLQQWGERLAAEPDLTVENKMLLADMYSCVGRHEEAIAQLEPIVEAAPYDKHAWILMTDVRARAGQEDEAREAAGYAIAIDDSDLRTIMAEYWFKAERYRRLKDRPWLTEDDEREMEQLRRECIEGMEWAVRCGVDDTDEYNLSVAELFLYIDEPLRAIPYLRRDLRFRLDNADVLLTLGAALIDVQDFAGARVCLEKILREMPQEAPVQTYAALAFCLFSLGEMDLCLTELVRATILDPEGTRRYFSTVFPLASPEEYYDLVRHFFASKA